MAPSWVRSTRCLATSNTTTFQPKGTVAPALSLQSCTYTYEPESGEVSISRLWFFPIHVHTDRCNSQIGQMVGALFAWVADWQGRRWPIFVGCIGVCVGSVITATAPTLGAFIGGRFILSFFSTIATITAPLYLIEIAPPQYRGTVAGSYNTLYYLGR
jgi:hypothetical protein